MKKQNRVAIFNILSTVLLKGIAIITGPLFSRLLGDSGYGTLKIYNIWTSIAAILITLQTHETLVNARVEYPEEEQKHYQSSVMSMSLLMFLVCSTLVLLFLEPISQKIQLEPMLIGLMLLQAFGTFCVHFLNTKNNYEFKAGRNMLMSLAVTLIPLVLSVIIILQLPHETRYYGRVWANALTYGVIGIFICIWILVRGKTFYDGKYWKFCIVLAIPAVFHNLSSLILNQSDQLMLQHMMSTATVGHYAYAYTLSNFLFVIFEALNKTWCPFFFDEMKRGKLDDMMNKSRNFLELFTVLACGFILLAPEVYHLYAAKDFWVSTSIIPLFVTSFYVNFLCTFPVNYEYYHKKTKVVAAVTIGSSLFNLVLNIILIKAIGMTGAALATMISQGLQLVLHHVYCSRILGKEKYPFPVSVWAKYALGYGAVAAVVYLTPNVFALPDMLVRWGIGAVLGILELRQILKRKVLI